MQFAIRTRQLARLYVDAQSLVATEEQLAELIKTANLATRMATPTVVRLMADDPTLPAGSPPRFVLASTRLDWQLAILGHSFDLSRLPTDLTGSNIGELSEFAAIAAEILWECSRVFGRTGHRMALVQSGMLAEMSDKQLDAVARRLLHLPASFETHPVFEWDWRIARRGTMHLGDREDSTHVLATVKRASGLLHVAPKPGSADRADIPFDRINVELDVNTSTADTRGRFGEKEVKQFFSAALDEHTHLAKELATFAFEDPS